MLWTVGLGETSLSRHVKIHMSISRVGYCGTPCMWVCARATDRLTLISLLQNVQSGVDLNTYFPLFSEGRSPSKTKIPKYQASFSDSKDLLP